MLNIEESYPKAQKIKEWLTFDKIASLPLTLHPLAICYDYGKRG
jgi:hypothetical protein